MPGINGGWFGVKCSALVVGAACAVTRPCDAQVPLAERDSIQAQVQAALDSLTDAWRRVDIDAELRFYLDSALLAYNGTFRSTSEERAGAKRRRPSLLGQTLGPFRSIRFDVLSRDVVVVSWVNAFTVIDTGGRAEPTRVAANTYVWVRRGGAWRILASHESTRISHDSSP